MSQPHQRFPRQIQEQALLRQGMRCATCGMRITAVGEGGRAEHRFGERAEGHHVIPHLMGGPITVQNCAVLCQACHLSAHQGGYWADISIYNDVKALPMDRRIAKIGALYPYYGKVS